MAVTFGLATPALMGATALAVDYSTITANRSRLQAITDAAALTGARELKLAGVAPQSAVSAAQAYVDAHGAATREAAVSFAGTVSADKSSVKITLVTEPPTYIAGFLGIVPASISVTATAQIRNGPPICVIGLDPAANFTIGLDKNARMIANGCAVYSNSTKPNGLFAKNSALLQSGFTCTSGGRDGGPGNFAPEPVTGCPVMPDPLASRPAPAVSGCDPTKTNMVISSGSQVLYPGTYCGGLRVTGGATVQLMAGVYIIKDGLLRVDTGASLSGSYVGFYFTGKGAAFEFNTASNVNLTGPKDGVLAGLLFFQDRAADPNTTFRIDSDNATNLLGTIYLPKGNLQFGGSQPVAQNSAFTIIIAQGLSLDGGPTMYLNSNYSNSDVPVPPNVGSNSGTVALVN